jgi:hypothetical protein
MYGKDGPLKKTSKGSTVLGDCSRPKVCILQIVIRLFSFGPEVTEFIMASLKGRRK